MRIGIGYDVHRFEAGRPLVIGGVAIPWHEGLAGHSDADVLTHAVCDALLGAAGLGDIGRHFPDSDPAFKGISSLVLLETVSGLLEKAGYEIENVDAVLVAQAPRFAPYREEMERRLAKACGLGQGRIGIKATTTERLGFEGRGEGIAAQAVALIRKI